MITRLLAGILAAVLLPLGVALSILSLAGPDGFDAAILAFPGAGLACAAVFAILHARAARRRERRRAGTRACATVVRAKLLAGVRIGSLLTFDLTVAIPAAGEVTQRVAIAPGIALRPGEAIEVVYDPADPSNFEPAEHVDLTGGTR